MSNEHPSDGYAYASSRRFPREPDTIIVDGATDCPRYKCVGMWKDERDDNKRYRAFRKQAGEGPRYVFQLALFGA